MKIAIVGKGNVGFHLYTAFRNSSTEVKTIDSRSLDGIDATFDLVLIAVSDRAIESVADHIAKKLPLFNGVVAHTAGSVDINIFFNRFQRFGVFYPLQTFSKDIKLTDYSEIPIFVEGNNERSVTVLETAASLIFHNIITLSSNKRKRLHLASVFACNFVNALYQIGSDILEEENISFEALRPLIKQTAKKVMAHSPSKCQTGPARRGDAEVMNNHLQLLADRPDLMEIYSSISNLIMKQNSLK